MKYIYIITCGLLISTALSCNKTLEVEIPLGTNTSAVIFSNVQSANVAMRGVYENLTGAFQDGAVPFQRMLTENLGLSSDEFLKAVENESAIQYNMNDLLPSNADNKRLWDKFYNYVYQSNLLVKGLTDSKTLAVADKNNLVAEARFIRGLSYFYLVNMFGNIPLTITSNYLVNQSLAQSKPEEVYMQMIEDLEFAKENMGSDFTTAGSRFRASKIAATALLARVYLYNKEWAKAEAEATKVINQQPLYKLEGLGQVFLATSAEAIFALDNPLQVFHTLEVNVAGANATNTACLLTPFMISQFQDGDQRLSMWTRPGTGAGAGSIAPFKYKRFSNSAATVEKEAVVILRLAEQFLIRAEARAMQNDPAKHTLAVADLDVIRLRAGAKADHSQDFKTIAFEKPLITQAELVKAVYQERLLEMFAEYGHRWMDAKRSGQSLNLFFEGRKPGITDSDANFPIPVEDIIKNKNLKQNEGYF